MAIYELYEDDAENRLPRAGLEDDGVGGWDTAGKWGARNPAWTPRAPGSLPWDTRLGASSSSETAAQAKARGGSNTVIRRELAEVATPATRTDGDVGDDAVAAPDATHILAFAEEEDEEILDDEEEGEKEGEKRARLAGREDAFGRAGSRAVGYSFLDAAAGTIHLGVLPPSDDEHGTALATRAQVSPRGARAGGRVSGVRAPRARQMRRQASSHRAHRRRGIPGGRGVRGSRSGAGIGFIVVEVGVERDGRRRARPVARACAAAVAAPLAIIASRSSPGWRRPRNRTTCTRTAAFRMDACTMTNLELVLGAEGTAEGVDAEAYLVRVLHGRGASNVARSMDRVAASRRGDDYREAGRGLGRRGSRFGGGGGGGERDAGFARAPDLERAVGRARAARNAGLVGGSKFALSLPPHLARPRHARRVAALAAVAAAVRRARRATNDFAAAIGDDDLKRIPALFRRFVEAGRFDASALEIADDVLREVVHSSLSRDDSKASVKKPTKAAFGASLASSRIPAATTTTRRAAIRDADEVCTALLERFLEHSGSWVAAAAACAEVDAVSSLAAFARDGVRRSPCAAPFS